MNLLEQCQKWTEAGEYQKIIDTITSIDEESRTPEINSELARAYNNIAESEEKEYFQKALDLLLPYEEYFGNEHKWNFRTAFSYYYLDKDLQALHYFKKALIEKPDDEDTLEFIEDCSNRLSIPYFDENFKERTIKAWQYFEKEEEKLRNFIDKKYNSEAEKYVQLCSDILKTAFTYVAFEMGHNGEKYELILSPEGNNVKLFSILYFADHAPESILKNWNIIAGRTHGRGFSFRTDDIDINGEDVKVWVNKTGEDNNIKAALKVYCEKLLPLLKENESKAWWILTTYTDNTLGEIANMRYVDSFDILEKEEDAPYTTYDKLQDTLRDMGLNMDITAKEYVENNYTGYSMKPSDEEYTFIRQDVIAGSTRLPYLIDDYLSDSIENMCDLHDDGITAGFFFFPVETFMDNGTDASKLFDFRDEVEAELMEKAGSDAVVILGGATGTEYGYIDFIAYDLKAVLDAGVEIFSKGKVDYAGFHTFIRDTKSVKLYEKTKNEPVKKLKSR